MIDYRFNGRLTYIPGGALSVNMSAWPSAGVGTSPGTTNLLAWWSLDETSGTRQDSHTGNRDMSVQGTPSYTTGKKNNAGTIAVTNGAGSYFYCNDGGALNCNAGESITVAGWMYFNSMPSNHGYPVTRWGNGGPNTDWAFVVPNNGALTFSVGRDPSNQSDAVLSAGTITSGAWYFFVGIFDHTVGTHGTVYVSANNGTKGSTALPSAKRVGTVSAVAIGDLSHTAIAYGNMAGAVDEVCVYQRVLTDDELAWLYNNGAGRAYSEL
jgi:hypothetical protein